MGYDLHITRKENWHDEDGPIIALKEWQDYTEGDPEMSPEDGVENGAVWTIDAKGKPHSTLFYLGVSGDIIVKHPNEESQAKMCQIASRLGAKVQGDEDEIYTAKVENVTRNSRGWWQLLSLVAIVFLLLAMSSAMAWSLTLVGLTLLMFIGVMFLIILGLVMAISRSLRTGRRLFFRWF